MDFLTKNANMIKTGNLALTTVLVAGIVGMTGFLLHDFRTATNTVDTITDTVLVDTAQISYEGDSYRAYASMFTILVVISVCLGVVLSKVNNEHIQSEYLTTAVMFIVPVIAVVMLVLASIPSSDDEDPTDANTRQSAYDITGIILISFIVGVASHHSRVFQSNHILGTGLFLTLSLVALGLIAYMYQLLVVDNEKDDYARGSDNLLRKLTTNEKNVLTATLAFVAIIVAGGILHIVMERKYFNRVFGGRKSPTRRSPTRKSPKRKSSPRRKLGTLRP